MRPPERLPPLRGLAFAVILLVGASAVMAPLGLAAPMKLADVTGPLTLGTANGRGALWELMTVSVLSSWDAAERAAVADTWSDPVALLELPFIPTSLLESLTLDRIGPVHGPGVAEVPIDVLLSAIALLDGGPPISAERLRSFTEHASIEGFEDSAAQAEDLAALRGER